MLFSFKRSISLSVFFITASLLLIGNATSVYSAEEQKGTVVETMDAANYTYMKVKTKTESVWVAIPTTPVKIGQEVTYTKGMEMRNFESKTLGRTFDSIIFSPGLGNGKSMSSMSPHGKMDKAAAPSSFADAVKKEAKGTTKTQTAAETSSGSAGATVPFLETKVEKAEGSNSYTVGEVFEQADTLNGKKIRIRGKVVKISPNIMGKNWIHIQDGTGDPMKNSHDLVVTTTEMTKVDQVILVEGTMMANKDFGSGYKYAALIEEAVISE